MSVIAIAGKARAGKNQSAKYIAEYLNDHGYKTLEYAFADPLKEFLGRIFGWSCEELYGGRKERVIDCELHMDIVECVVADVFTEHLKSRGDLKNAVAALKEVLNESFCVSGNWLSPIIRFQASPRLCLQKIGTEWAQAYFGKTIWVSFVDTVMQQNPDRVLLVPDVRFSHEALWVRDNGILLNIKRDTSKYNVFSEHDSEKQFDEISRLADDVIMNYGSLTNLREDCESIAFSYTCGAYGIMGCGK